MSIAEELKLPFMQIARQAELGLILPEPQAVLDTIQTTADASLRLLDSYVQCLRLALAPPDDFVLEPTSVAAVLYGAQSQLAAVARQYNVSIDLHVDGKYEPVLAHPQTLEAALVNLGYALIEALPAMGAPQLHLQLAAHRTAHGIVAGMYVNAPALTPNLFRRAQHMHGKVRQPLTGLSPGAGAGIFVADAMLQTMTAKLRPGRFQKLPGFAVTLPPSQQLALV